MTSYLNLTESDKQKVLELYYAMIPSKEIQKTLDISHRCYRSVLKEFNINGKLKNRYSINEAFFDKIDNDEKAYILGYIAADGYVGNEQVNNVIISSNDIQILEDIKNSLCYTGQIKNRGKGGFENSKDNFVIAFSNKHIASTLRKYGLVPNKSLIFNAIPNCIPSNLVRSFIRGYFDGDGGITLSTSSKTYKNKKYQYRKMTVSIIGTKPFLEDCVCKMNITNYSLTQSHTPEMFYLRVHKNSEILKLFQEFYSDSKIHLNRKYLLWKENLGLCQKWSEQRGLIAGKHTV
jgi:hypothetical protein